MAGTIKLKNLKRQMRVFNLEHPTFLNQEGEHPVGRPETLTMLSRETRDVHPDTTSCVEVAAALRPKKGRPSLRVVG